MIWLTGSLFYALIAAVLLANTDQSLSTNSSPPVLAFIFTFFITSAFFLPVGVVLSVVLRAFKFRKDSLVKVEDDTSVLWYQLWEQREEARQMLAQSQIPVDYFEFLELDPQRFMGR